MITIPKGTKDVLPEESYKWHYLEAKAKEVAAKFCFKEIRTPVFEHTELFLRGVGDTTDVVSKEMYTFEDKGARSITLKPEGTAGVARCFVENSLIQNAQPTKMYYITPVFRYEKPQAGRLREHHQFGIELYGSETAAADVEVIALAKSFFDTLGLTKLSLNINSIGCPECRKNYNEALKNYLGKNLDTMCPTCKERFQKNPLRILDCKVLSCKQITANAPAIIDFLCEPCQKHHDELCNGLNSLGIDFVVNPKIVRGLDYYTRTVFEFVSEDIGAQGTVCGGGRYDGLVEQIGGKPCAGVGFGLGLERLLLTLETLGLNVGDREVPDIYLAPCCVKAKQNYQTVAMELRRSGFKVEYDLMNRSLKAQMKYADKIGAKFVAIMGEEESEKNCVTLKNLSDGSSSICAINDLAAAISVK